MQRVKPCTVMQKKILSSEFVSSDVADNHVPPLLTVWTEQTSCHIKAVTWSDEIKFVWAETIVLTLFLTLYQDKIYI